MTSHAILYDFMAAWQCPRPMNRYAPGKGSKPPPAEPADDAPAVAVSKPEDLDKHPTVRIAKAWWALALTQGAAVAVILGGYYKLDARIAKQEDRLEALVHWLKDPKAFPATKGIVSPDPTAQTIPLPGPSPSSAPMIASVSPDPQAAPSAATPVRAMPGGAKPVLLQSCVDRKARRVIQCDPDTLDCYGKESFNPDFFRKMRADSGAGDWMLICDPKKSP